MGLKENIKAKRIEKQMTLEELACKVGVSRQTIQRYESGTISNIPSDKIELMAKALETTPAYLMGWEDEDAILSKLALGHRRLGDLYRKKEDISGKDNTSEDMIMKEIMALKDEIQGMKFSLYSIKQNKEALITAFTALNRTGQDKLVEYAIDLTKISEYQIEKIDNTKLPKAAHERTDIEVTDEMRKHDDDIMNDDSEWE